MTFKEYCKKYDEIKMKYDIIVLSEEQEKFIISEAEKLSEKNE